VHIIHHSYSDTLSTAHAGRAYVPACAVDICQSKQMLQADAAEHTCNVKRRIAHYRYSQCNYTTSCEKSTSALKRVA